MVQHIKEYVLESDAKMSAIFLGFYATNWKMRGPWTPQKHSDGSFVNKQLQDRYDKRLVPFIITRYDTGEFVRALVQAPPDKNMHSASEQFRSDEWIEI
jgi:hypothetical protein